MLLAKPRSRILALAIIAFLFIFCTSALAQQDIFGLKRETDFQDYLDMFPTIGVLEDEIVIDPVNWFVSSPEVTEWSDPTGEFPNAIYTGEDGYVEWQINVPKAGLYNLGISYYPVKGRRSTIQREVLINGERPYLEAGYLEFHRIWGDSGPARIDNQGNMLRSTQVELPAWRNVLFSDSMGTFAQPLSFHFNEGLNTIRLLGRREPLVIGELRVLPIKKHETYEQVKVTYDDNGLMPTSGISIKVQGEEAVQRSSPSLFPITDRSDPTVEPYHHTLLRLNAIGGERWSRPGDWIAWEVDVPQSGLYQIAIKAKQNIQRGSYSSRKLTIDGSIPFAEAEAIQFPYSTRYQMNVVGNRDSGEKYLFYLDEGKHIIQLENVLGELADILRITQDSLYELNTIYRRIVMITSANPDPMRDYQLQERIPGLINALRRQSEIMGQLARELQEITSQSGTQVAILEQLSRSLWIMAEKPESIPRRLEAFRDNAGALGTWILDTREQPLQIDYLMVTSPDVALPKATPNIIEVIKHEVGSFIASFTHDYTLIGDIYEEDGSGRSAPLKVWMGSGRDQAQILKLMIEDTFTPNTGIPVNLELIEMGVLLPATLAKRGPDVALGVQDTQPMDFALRGAAVDLTQFSDFNEVAERFHSSALVPYSFRDSIYGLPETQSFAMLFYRKDILEELDLEPPKTWDDVLRLVPDLNKDHMDFGLPYSGIAQGASGSIGEGSATVSVLGHGGVSTLLTLLFQQGESLYLPDGKATNLHSEAAIDSFTRWTELYELYDLPLWYDAANRFRMGEMPVLVSDFQL
ncbi:MAG: extracellular solute-binding protein, partial [Bacillota bacterium]|nr:extracellular solute-binding protein [Bacillota bacterium]